MLMDELFVYDALAIGGIFLSWLLIRKQLLIFPGILLILVGFHLLISGDLQYISGISYPTNSTTVLSRQEMNITDGLNITETSTTTSLTDKVPVYSSLILLGLNIASIIALAHIAFGLIMGFKAMWED